MEGAEALVEMHKELYVAAMLGDVRFLEQDLSDEYLLRKTHKKNNIIHIAVRNQRLDFIEAILWRFQNNREQLICEENSQKDTPLHTAAEVGNLQIGGLIYGHLKKMRMIEGAEKPWRVKNLKGNTAAHHALIHGNLEIAMFLLHKDPGFARLLNHSDETLLHLAITHFLNEAGSEPIRWTFRAHQPPVYDRAKEETTTSSMMIISTLVKIAGDVTCWHDTKGLTPLHRAASLDIPYNFQASTLMITQWPESAEECDNSGKTILHLLINRVPIYRDCVYLLRSCEVYNLRNCQDHQGNTPLHIAASNMDVVMVRTLLEFNTNLDINNMEGISSATLIQQHNIMEVLWEHQMSREECEAVDKADIRFLTERLNVLGIEFLRSSDSKGQNILHKLFKVDFHKYPLPIDEIIPFILQGLNLDPGLLVSTDSNSDTPLHVAARHNLFLLHMCHEFIEYHYDPLGTKPWLLKNADGNTPLHLALLHYNPSSYDDIFHLHKLFSYDFSAIAEGNRNRENAFHLVKERNFEFVLRSLVESYRKALENGHTNISWWVCATDYNGITPLMKMVQEGRESSALGLIEYFGKDPVTFGLDYTECNTVLHMAVKNSQFELICKIIELYDVPGQGHFLGDIFEQTNKKAETAADLLGDFDIVPLKLEEKIWSHPLLRGIRSTWRIPNSQLQNYMSSMNVIAALLTTITFTAAFIVPGGLNQETGTPLLMESIAFQVFMIADVIAMCLSMMVLFCLLWIVATNKRNAVMIQDFAISLLLASFVATLLTFMMGVYATIYPVKPWIANTTLVLCSILMLLVRKYIFTNLLLPLKNAIAHPIHILTSKCTSAVNYCIHFLIYYTIQLGKMVLRL